MTPPEQMRVITHDDLARAYATAREADIDPVESMWLTFVMDCPLPLPPEPEPPIVAVMEAALQTAKSALWGIDDLPLMIDAALASLAAYREGRKP